MRKMAGFGFRLNVVLGLVCVLCVLSILFLNSTLSRRALEDEIRERTMPAVIDGIESAISLHFDVPAKSFQFLAQRPILRDWIAGGEQQEGFEAVIQACRTYVAVFGTGHVNLGVNGTRTLYRDVDLGDRPGQPLDPVIDKWFDDFAASGLPIGVNIHAPDDPEYGGRAFVNVRVNDERGNFLGVMGASVNSRELVTLLGRKKVGDSGVTFIVRNDGTILLHPDPARVNTPVTDQPEFAAIAPDMLVGLGGFFRTATREGETLLVATGKLPALGATIVTVASDRELFSDIDRVRNFSMAAGLVALLIALLSVFRVTSKFTGSLQRVINFAGKVASGTVSEPFESNGDKETQELAAALNNMNAQLRRSNFSLAAVHGILDGLDTFIYVTDPETDEILFINARMKHALALADVTEEGRCWELFYPGQTERCADCPVNELRRDGGKVVQRNMASPSGRHYRYLNTFIDWAGDRTAHLMQGADVTDVVAAEDSLKRRLAQQELLLSMSQSFFSPADTSTLIANVVNMTGEFVGIGRTRLSRYDETQDAIICEYEWRNRTPQVPALKGSVIPFGQDHPFYRAFITEKKPYLAIADINEMPGLYALPNMNVKSLIDVPVFVAGRLWGLLGVDECENAREWSETDILLFRHVSGLLSGLLYRRFAEENLNRMSSLMEEAPQYITYVNEAGEFQYFNAGTSALLGYSPEELAEGGLPLIFGPEAWEHVRRTIIPGIIEEGRATFEMPVIRKDGETRVFAFTAFRGSAQGAGVGAIGMDITDKRALESQLVAARDAAEQSSQAKSEFLSRMSHEMRTPLNAVIGMAHIARTSDDIRKKEYCLEKIDNASTHLLGVINDILDMSKIEANKFELAFSDFVFERMLLRIMNVATFRVGEKAQRFTVRVDPAIPFSLVSDEQRLGQVIANLLSNAVKFTPTGGTIALDAALQEDADGECVVRVSVTDSGIGVTPEQQERLFRPFEQADGGISRKFGGTGLGLAISRKIVELLGGRIWVESEQDKGATFTFTFRAARGRQLRPETPGSALAWNQVRVLVLDREPAVRDLFASLAAECGFACTGLESWDAVNARLADSAGFADSADCVSPADCAHTVVFADEAFFDPADAALRAAQGAASLVVMSASPELNGEHGATGDSGVSWVSKPLLAIQIMEGIAACVAGDASGVVRAEGDAAGENGLFAGRRLLLAEDVDLNREIVISLLEHTGVSIDCAENGREAVSMFLDAPERYDLVFMDIHMPEVDGYDAVRQIRACGKGRAADVPIIAMTANAFREDIEKCLAVGMNGHLSKPVIVDDLMKALHTYIPKACA